MDIEKVTEYLKLHIQNRSAENYMNKKGLKQNNPRQKQSKNNEQHQQKGWGEWKQLQKVEMNVRYAM